MSVLLVDYQVVVTRCTMASIISAQCAHGVVVGEGTHVGRALSLAAALVRDLLARAHECVSLLTSSPDSFTGAI